MARTDVQGLDPERYNAIREEQQNLKRQFQQKLNFDMKCPYCGHRVASIARGQHGFISIKCPHCGEDLTFPPIRFRTAG